MAWFRGPEPVPSRLARIPAGVLRHDTDNGEEHMAGSHRDADAKVRTLGIRSVIVLVVVVIATISFGTWTVAGIFGGPGPGGEVPAATKNPASASPSSAEAPSSAPSSPTATDSAQPPVDLPSIPEASPRRLRSGALIDAGFDAAIIADSGRFTAASASELSRLATRGRPGSPGTDTVVVIGEDRFDRTAALNRIGDLEVGDSIELETYNADLSYTVEKATELDAAAVPADRTLSAKVPGRLVLVAITYDSTGNRTGRDTVVTARLTGATLR